MPKKNPGCPMGHAEHQSPGRTGMAGSAIMEEGHLLEGGLEGGTLPIPILHHLPHHLKEHSEHHLEGLGEEPVEEAILEPSGSTP